MTTDIAAAITPLTVLEFGEQRLLHIRTAPAGVTPGEAFLQIIRLHRDSDDRRFGEPTLLVACMSLSGELSGFWYLSSQLATINALVDDCMVMSSEEWWTYLAEQQVSSAQPVGVTGRVADLGRLLNLHLALG